MSQLAGIGKVYRSKLSRVLEQHAGVITPSIVAEVLQVPTQESGRLLARWSKQGWVRRVKRGVYLPISLSSTSTEPVVEEPYLIAEAIYGPGYIGGFSAVKHWDLSEQIIETVTYFTRKNIKNRNPIHGDVKFRIKTVVKHKIFGLKTIWVGSKKIFISDPTKTVVDLFDDPNLVGGMTIVNEIFSEYYESDYYDFDLLLRYILRISNKSIFKRLGFLLDTSYSINEEQLLILRRNMSEGYSIFDPATASTCTVSKWRLKMSQSWKGLYDRKE